MILIPFEKIRIETYLTKDEVKARLLKRMGTYKAKNYKRIDPNYFSGKLNEDNFIWFQFLTIETHGGRIWSGAR